MIGKRGGEVSGEDDGMKCGEVTDVNVDGNWTQTLVNW